MDYKLEKTFTHAGKQCAIIFSSLGHRCGYVAVTKESPLFGIDHMDLGLEFDFHPNVHGGITYSEYGNCYPMTTKPESYWFGFDCAQLYDGKDIHLVEKYFGQKEAELVAKYYDFTSRIIRSLEYCIMECILLANQLTQLEKTIETKD